MSIFDYFKHLNLSNGQEAALTKLEAFLESPVQVFMLKGYAGSGKTTILKGLVEYLSSLEKDFALMAPTGRAAKVIRERTRHEAYTIHKSIYCYEEMVEVDEGESFFYYYKIRNNTDVANKIFIVDEASMLSDAKSDGEFFRFGTGHLLSDLITYTRVNNKNTKSKIIFVGDPCQLSPVSDDSSKAFDEGYLIKHFQLTIESTEIKEVMRQEEESGILKAGAKIRKSISAGFFNDFNLTENGKDIFNPSYESFLDTWQSVSSPKIIIASKNKTCLDLNLQIRERKYGTSNLPMQRGDIVILGGNNYRKGVFNGEFGVVNEVSPIAVSRTIGLRGKPSVTLSWRDIELVFPDTENTNKMVKGKILENFLYGDNVLRPEESQALYVDFTSRHKDLKPKSEEFKEAIINDEYFNCLLMKYGYAVTCHKAQGGEWDNVFTVWDHDNNKEFNCFTDPQLRSGKSNEHFYRWAYTAITRASSRLFAINPPTFNSYSSMSFINTATINSLNHLTGQQIQSEVINIDTELSNKLTQLGLFDKPLGIQDHFIKVDHALRPHYIDISGHALKNMEIFYYFRREGKTAGLKTWINKEGMFNGKYQKLPGSTNSEELYKEIESLLKNLPNISIKRNTVETIISKIQFDIEMEEKFPFTKSLFDDLENLLVGSGILIDNVDHLEYKERYTLKRNGEKAEIDFEYKKNGFFGRIIPISNNSNSDMLIQDLFDLVQSLKFNSNASVDT